jgi:hypothetical protein
MAIKIPLSQSGPPAEFARAVEDHRKALIAHMMGKPGVAPPTHNDLVNAVIERRPQTGPIDKRGPDQFVILPYEIVDDTPVSPAVQLLRDSIRN